MKTEASAGGIVVRKSRQGWEVLLMCDMKGNWTFPKGLIEGSEKPLTTAKREIKEEVGLTRLVFVTALTPTSYMYHRGALIKKTVYYFLFRASGREKPTVQVEEGISEAKWFSLHEALTSVGYPKTNKPLLEETRRFFINLVSNNTVMYCQ